jgi:hypothetical protein
MADQTFMFIVTAGTMAGLAVLLFVSRGRRLRAIKTTDKEHALSPGSSSSQGNGRNKKGKQTKKYSSDGKPVYEDK